MSGQPFRLSCLCSALLICSLSVALKFEGAAFRVLKCFLCNDPVKSRPPARAPSLGKYRFGCEDSLDNKHDKSSKN